MPRRGRAALTILAVLAVAVAALALLLHAVATSWQPTIVLTGVAHWLMWPAPIGTLLAAGVRRWILAVIAGLTTVLAGVVQIPDYVATAAPASGTTLTVMQANLAVGSADPATVVRLVRDRRVDLLATEELTTGEQRALIRAGLADALPHRYTAPLPDGGGGLGIWSRFPLSDEANLPGFQLGVLHAEVALPGRIPLTFVAVHLLPPYPYAPGEWLSEIDRLRGVLAGLPAADRVIVAGDFNATDDHVQFRRLLTGGYADAADEAGAGYLPTYPTDRWFGPLAAIDHVLTRGATATSLDTFGVAGSDHRILVAHIVLAPSAG